jgi:outer membrane protein TolC
MKSNNQEFQVNKYHLQNYKKEVDKAEGRYLPSVNFSSSYTMLRREGSKYSTESSASMETSKGWSAHLQLIQEIYDGGKRFHYLSKMRHDYENERYSIKHKNSLIVLEMIQAYLNLIKHNALAHIAHESAKEHHKALSRAKKARYLGGEILSVKKIEAMVYLAKEEEFLRKDERQKAFNAYVKLTDIEPHDLERPLIDNSLIPSDVHRVVELAIEESSELKMHEALINRQYDTVSHAYGEFLPAIRAEITAQKEKDA